MIFSYISCIPITKFDGTSRVRNQYGLKIIDSKADYLRLISIDSNNKMIDIEKYLSGIKLDIKYATTDNFTKVVVYSSSSAFLRLPVAQKLKEVLQELKSACLGLIIYDAYRPYSITLKFWEMYKDTNFVAAPWTGSRHNRGAALDCSLYDLKTGLELSMPTKFDDFSEKAQSTYMNLPQEKINNRELLIRTMSKYGFRVYPSEWWHFDFLGYEKFDLLDLQFMDFD